LTETCTIKLCC